jgi:lipopolysaccharide export system protein LptA
MGHHHSRIGRRTLSRISSGLALLFAPALLLMPLAPSLAQLSGRATGFVAPSPADAEGNRDIIRGDTFRTLPGGLIEIGGLTIETYRQHQKDLIIQASNCLYNRSQAAAYSDGTLEVMTAGERFSVQGQGFRWQQKGSLLTISNAVQMVVRGKLKRSDQPSPEKAEDPLSPSEPAHIFGDHFVYDGKRAVFTGNVRATQEESVLLCQQLTGQFNEDGDLILLDASGAVLFEQPELQAGGDQGIYHLVEDRIILEGNATWKAGERQGAARRLLIEPGARHFTAIEEVVVQLPASQMMAMGNMATDALENGAARPPATDDHNLTNQFVTIASGHLDYTPELAVFSQSVLVTASEGSRLSSGDLTISFDPEDGGLRQVIARENVVFEQPNSLITGKEMTYNAQTGLIIVPENPRWNFDNTIGSSDLLLIRPDERRFRAEGNVRVKMDGLDLTQVDLGFPHENRAPDQSSETNQVIFITAALAEYDPDFAMFRENVRVLFQRQDQDDQDKSDAAGEIHSSRLAILWEEGQLSEIIADGEVRLKQGDLHGTGQRAHYWLLDGLIELTGDAVITTPTRRIRSDVLYLDRLRQTFRTAQGNFRIEAVIERNPSE